MSDTKAISCKRPCRCRRWRIWRKWKKATDGGLGDVGHDWDESGLKMGRFLTVKSQLRLRTGRLSLDKMLEMTEMGDGDRWMMMRGCWR